MTTASVEKVNPTNLTSRNKWSVPKAAFICLIGIGVLTVMHITAGRSSPGPSQSPVTPVVLTVTHVEPGHPHLAGYYVSAAWCSPSPVCSSLRHSSETRSRQGTGL